MSNEISYCKHKCEPSSHPKEYCKNGLCWSLSMDQILVSIKLNMAKYCWLWSCKVVCKLSHMAPISKHRPVVDGWLFKPKHFLYVLIIWFESESLQCHPCSFWESYLYRKPVKGSFFCWSLYVALLKINVLSISKQKHRFAFKPSPSCSILCTNRVFYPWACCQIYIHNFTL